MIDVGAELERMRGALRLTSVVAFADLTAKMVLRSSTQAKMPQEELDALCAEAGAVFASPVLKASDEKPEEFEDCILISGKSVSVFLRSRAEPGDALIFRCDRNVDLHGLLADGRETLEKISAG